MCELMCFCLEIFFFNFLYFFLLKLLNNKLYFFKPGYTCPYMKEAEDENNCSNTHSQLATKTVTKNKTNKDFVDIVERNLSLHRNTETLRRG